MENKKTELTTDQILIILTVLPEINTKVKDAYLMQNVISTLNKILLERKSQEIVVKPQPEPTPEEAK